MVVSNSNYAVLDGWLSFKSSIPRSKVPKILNDNDVFIHAYLGSLDKTLIEATFIGLPVITLNVEYQREFGAWNELENVQVTLGDQVQYLKSLPQNELALKLKSRKEIAFERHSLEKWVEKLVLVLA